MGICCCCCNKATQGPPIKRSSSLSNMSTKRFDLDKIETIDQTMEQGPFLDMNPVLLESSASEFPSQQGFATPRRSSILMLSQGKLSFGSSVQSS